MASLCSLFVAALAGTAAAATTGSFNVLSMNVAGLPAILQNNDETGDKKTNAGTIGTDFAKYGYNVIHVQEDFNYHAYIYAADNHKYRTATSGGAAIGSGLNTLASFDWVDFTRVKWNTCSDASSNDCETPKGFTFMRVIIDADSGVFADFYNLHADAGTETGDETARTANLEQVAAYIDTWSVGNAVLVFGDTNSRYTRAADNITVFARQNGLTDAWVQLERAGVNPTVETLCDNPTTSNTCETVDKVFYRGNAVVDLKATYFNYESKKFLQANGSVLTDHNPITVSFDWTLSNSLRQSSFWGGPHGSWFSDLPTLKSRIAAGKVPKPSVLSFSGASRLDSVGLTLTDGTVFSHGGTGGTAASLTLGATEYWVSAELCQGEKNSETRAFYIKATTSSGKTLTAGTATSDCATFTAPTGWQIVGFVGQDGDEVDQLAFVYGKK
ncbi:endonuclease exonuclease phosphatase family protein [Grosmannia clavigera kw1407]|uniref:Endonuclease exonuclease phosphatase family protein n=1 Tax=Grosmannia clavigera (strain kw1407 / UAMH 11150) TaxID=655863 RepID=F0XDD8_GROCL|nr:endonuclease exonuclease phosphatase family protein [Grosmannia clavigera kw1407]EFX04473.1 endonuclease exonuclease phosphatase family protein [Grosmannia clavigera kw1407]